MSFRRLRPSRATLTVLATLSAIAAACCFWAISGDVNCSPDLTCMELITSGANALLAGCGIAAMLTALLILIGQAGARVVGSALVLEPSPKGWPIAAILLVAHFVAFLALHQLGVLPVGWDWWQGAFGFIDLLDPDRGPQVVGL
jgi:hypothetical protein